MRPVTISIISPFLQPPKEAELVIFSGNKNYVAQYDSPKFLRASVKYAKKYGVFLMPNRFIAGDYLCLCLISPEGGPILGQKAVHLNLDYRGIFKRGEELGVAETPFGRVALAVDVDLNFPQFLRAAAGRGAQLVLASQFIQLFDFYEERINYGPVAAALSSHLPVAAAVSAGGVIVDRGGAVLAGYLEDQPVTAAVTPAELGETERADVKTGERLMALHLAGTDVREGA